MPLAFTRCRLVYQVTQPLRKPAIPSTAPSLYKKGDRTTCSTSPPLLILISFLCTALGRPAALQFEGSSIAEPQDFPFLRYFVQFAKVTSAIKEMHQNQDQSLEAFSKTCSRLVHRLHNIAHSASESLGVDFSQRLQVKDCGVHPVLLKLGIRSSLPSCTPVHSL